MNSTLKSRSLWSLGVSPLIWVLQFLASYVTVAIHCAKTPDADFGDAELMVTAYAAAGLLLLVIHGASGLGSYFEARLALDSGGASNAVVERNRFLGLVCVMLAVIASIATIYGGLALLMVRGCS